MRFIGVPETLGRGVRLRLTGEKPLAKFPYPLVVLEQRVKL